MTEPVPVYPNQTIAGSRRTEGGAFYLTPNRETRAIVAYLALHYAQRHNIRLLALVIMSNHIHWVGDDIDGNYPAFIRDFHTKVTEVMNEFHGRRGPMWANCKPSRVRLLTTADVIDKLLYAVGNPVKDGIEPNAEAWPGLLFSPENAGQTLTFERPEYLTQNYNSYPPVVEYTVPVPKAYGRMPQEAVRVDFAARRRAKEKRLRLERGDKPFVGTEEALTRGPEYRPADEPAATLNKQFSCPPELARSAFEALCSFRRAYREARKSFLDGGRPTWPRGTYAMHTWHGCPRHGP